MRAGALIVAAALAGCVSKGRYEVVEVQLHATRTALSAKAGECNVAAQDADAERAALTAEIEVRRAELAELTARIDGRDAAIGRLEGERVGLVDEIARLEAELAARPAPKAGPTEVPAPVKLARQGLAEDLAALQALRVDEARRVAARDLVVSTFAALGAEGIVAVETRGDAAVLRIPTRVLFQEGFTTLSPRGQALIGRIAEGLGAVPHRAVVVEGHTDDKPVHSGEMASNWERGFSRAMAVLRALEGAGAPVTLSAASFADTRPVVPHASAEGPVLNPRVELVITVPEVRYPPEGEDGGGDDPAPGG